MSSETHIYSNRPNILSSLDKGGLGIGSLKSFNLALLQKWRWRMYSNPNAFWVKVIKALHGYEGGFDHHGCKTNGIWAKIVGSSNYLHSSGILPCDSIRFQVGCGNLIRFWKDTWLGNYPLHIRYNRLFRLDLDRDCLIRDHISNGQWSWRWSRTNLGARNLAYFRDLLLEISQIDIGLDSDSCVWSLANDGVSSAGATRRLIDDHLLPSLDSPTTWVKSLPRKVNIFMWRFKLDRLPHRLNLSSRGIEIPDIFCPSCNVFVESNQHIFFECNIAKDIWRLVRIWCDNSIPLFSSFDHWIDWLSSWSSSSEKFHRLYIIFAASLWLIWRFRNYVTFNSQSMRKCDIFDSIRLYSFSWLKFRGRKFCNWTDWLKSLLL
ncbi:RNA-directed DNA polymerase, eukaryota, reverse transcriptase zinc-binding domain protein [Tanacetum coccineum]